MADEGWVAKTDAGKREVRRWIRWHEAQVARMQQQGWTHPDNKELWERWMKYHAQELAQLHKWLGE